MSFLPSFCEGAGRSCQTSWHPSRNDENVRTSETNYFICKQPFAIIHNYGLIILTINYGSPDHRHHRYYYYIIDVSVEKKIKCT